jgi:dipeptidyl peptidase-like protein/NlpC/P60 family protein
MTFDRRITPVRPDLADERLRGRVEAERFAAGRLHRVTVPSAPVRRHPAPDAPLDTEALLGEGVTVFDEHEGWAWGQLERDGYVGYIPAAALGELGPAPTHRVAAIRSFLFPGPNLKLPPLDYVSLGSAVTVMDRDGDYARLAGHSWIYAPHLAELEARELDFVAVAERFLHTPYLWGGKTSLGLDCSGLVQVALAAAGIAAPRDTDMQQAQLGKAMGIGDGLDGLQRGDLVFWRGHVGIMTDAKLLLHANAHFMCVAVEPLAEAEARIRAKNGGPITAVRRLSLSLESTA